LESTTSRSQDLLLIPPFNAITAEAIAEEELLFPPKVNTPLSD